MIVELRLQLSQLQSEMDVGFVGSSFPIVLDM